MRAMMGGTVFPRRLTQLFADTKKSYENVVQTPHNGPEASSLHLRLRIQKDRLIAWGIQWSDRSTIAQAGDIDGSLDRAGISDLVASIMCSIRDLLDEAEGLSSSQTLEIPEIYGDVKLLGKSREPSWTTNSLTRLQEILRDLTTSIDTLCDLSRPRVEEWSQSGAASTKSGDVDFVASTTSTLVEKPSLHSSNFSDKTLLRSRDPNFHDMTDRARIDEGRLRLSKATTYPTSSPPSYESVATGAEDRALAYLSSSPLHDSIGKPTLDTTSEMPVLLDYGPRTRERNARQVKPDDVRYQEISLFFESLSGYQGLLRLQGWTVDADKSRCAYVYELPPSHLMPSMAHDNLQPRSLLSFLQNGGDTDTNNMPSLENRFRLARNIAACMMLLHAKGITHRNVNSNNIVFFVDGKSIASDEKVWKSRLIRTPYLTAFHQRALTIPTSVPDPTFASIYQHPNLGYSNQEPYRYAHDQYSLGLILLEIGLWMPIGKFWKPKYTRHDFKTRLQDIYLKKLSAKCGDGYMKVVLHCLTAVERDPSSDQNDRLQSNSKSDIELRFHQTIIVPLERCCLIDDVSDGDFHSSIGPIAKQEKRKQQTLIKRKPVLNQSLNQSLTNQLSLDDQPIIVEDSKQAAPSSHKIIVWSHDIPALYSKYWGSTMFPKLERILCRAISRWESYTIDLFMAGEDSETARPTVYMECTSTGKVRKILRHLNRDLRLFEIKVVSGQIVRSKAGKKKRKSSQKKRGSSASGLQTVGSIAEQCSLNPHYQQKPVCGASIGAFRNGNHLPPVSFGGAVLVDGEPYGMSVHHMLEEDDEIECGSNDVSSLHRSMAPQSVCFDIHPQIEKKPHDFQTPYQSLYPFEVLEPAEAVDASSEGYAFSGGSSSASSYSGLSSEPLYPFEISEYESDADLDSVEDDEFWLSPGFEDQQFAVDQVDDGEDGPELGDTVGIFVGSGDNLVVTQPAIDDVDQGFFPSDDERDEEHLCSHTLGHVHASSGIRRSRRDDLIHEIDWALIKINEQRSQAFNLVQGGGRFCKPTSGDKSDSLDSHPCKVMKASELGGLHVHASGRTSGLQTGMILPAMRMVRMPGRSFASHSWQVRGDFGEGGDSGAWVFDNATGYVCGHVLAYSSASGVAYIAPMEVLLDDMAATLGATVTLPNPSIKAQQYPYLAAEPLSRNFSRPRPSAPARDKQRGSSPSSRAHLGRTSPPLPTSPPALVHEMSGLNLAELSTDNSRKPPLAAYDRSSEAASKRPAGDGPSKRHSGGSTLGARTGGAVAGPSNERAGMPRGARLIKT
ncbi:hypothetical protein MMC17_003327 [Xylographa soralifera]|nr:hypothetical protein [Xylographa soralifera]